MFQQKPNTIQVPLLISLFVHGIILVCLPIFRYLPQKKPFVNLEVTYRSATGIKAKQNRGGVSEELLKVAQKNLPDAPQAETLRHKESPLAIDLSKLIQTRETFAVPKPKIVPIPQRKQKINLKNLTPEMSKDPAYLNYQNIIRKKIQDAIYLFSERFFYFDKPLQGKIFVSFIVSSNGSLREILIQDDKSSNEALLRKITLAAIQEAAPFNKFPKELNYDERIFNLEISFELE